MNLDTTIVGNRNKTQCSPHIFINTCKPKPQIQSGIIGESPIWNLSLKKNIYLETFTAPPPHTNTPKKLSQKGWVCRIVPLGNLNVRKRWVPRPRAIVLYHEKEFSISGGVLFQTLKMDLLKKNSLYKKTLSSQYKCCPLFLTFHQHKDIF